MCQWHPLMVRYHVLPNITHSTIPPIVISHTTHCHPPHHPLPSPIPQHSPSFNQLPAHPIATTKERPIAQFFLKNPSLHYLNGIHY